jgi:hypothetical protein
MNDFQKFAVAILGILLFFILVGGSIAAQVILWQNAWYIAVMHLVLIGFAVKPAVDIFKEILKYIS